jgi:hypothetical protein
MSKQKVSLFFMKLLVGNEPALLLPLSVGRQLSHSWWDPDPHLPALSHLRQVLKGEDSIHSVSFRAVCKPWSAVSQLMRPRPPTYRLCHTYPGIKSDDSIHSVFYRCLWAMGAIVSSGETQTPPIGSATPTLGNKSDELIHSCVATAVCVTTTVLPLIRFRPSSTNSIEPCAL